MPRSAWIVLSITVAILFLGFAGAAFVIASGSGSGSSSSSAQTTLALGEPTPRLEIPLARDKRALMLARRGGRTLIGIAAVPDGPVEVAAVRGEKAIEEERLSFRLSSRPVEASPCGYACWRLDRPARAGSLLAVAVKGGPTMQFDIPLDLPIDATPLYRQMTRTMAALRSYRFDESLTSGVGEAPFSIVEVQPPDRMRLRTPDGFRFVIIGKSRWDYRSGNWERAPFPGFRASFMWDGASNARLLRESRSPQRTELVIAAFDREPVPAWFKLYVDKRSSRVLRADMLSPSHFMQQRFRDFNAPIVIRPPK
jgi:hypothetical protein